ncbi:hypothetical protein [Mesorhizobium sp. M0491]|uniref:hypothetical protein n=1 Tax=Mesorhizobium sp. M0491 TaxID=2956950 RepID=UPI0033385460
MSRKLGNLLKERLFATLLTVVDAVYFDYGITAARALRRVAPTELPVWDSPAGSMGPKVGAAIEFVEATGEPAAIGKLDDAVEIADGRRGTRVDADTPFHP